MLGRTGTTLLFVIAGLLFLALCASVVVKQHRSTLLEPSDLIAPPLSPDKLERVEAYWQWVRLDPILALPGMDLTTIDRDIASLEASLQAFAPFYESEERAVIERHLFPIELLRHVALTEANRRDFVTDPSEPSALAYHEQLIATLRHYQEEANAFAGYFDTIDDFKIAFISGYTTAPHLAAELRELADHAKALEAKERERFACIETPHACAAIAEPFAAYSQPVDAADTTAFPVPPQADVYAELLEKYYLANAAAERDQPLVVKDSSLCYPYDTPVLMRVWWPRIHHDPTNVGIRTTAVNDILLQPSLDFGDHPYHKALLDIGITYDIQDTAPYFCLDYGKDSSEVFTALDVFDRLSAASVIPGAVEDEHLRRALLLEDEIRASGRHLHSSVVAEYFAAMDFALAVLGEKAVATMIGLDAYARFLELRLLWQSQSSSFNQSLLVVADLTGHLEKGILPRTKIPLEALLVTRSYMSFFYFTGNRTFAEPRQSFLKSDEAVPLNYFKIKSYRDEVSRELPLESFEEYLMQYVTKGRAFSATSTAATNEAR